MTVIKDDGSVSYLLTAKESWILEENWPSFYSSLLTTYTQVLKNGSIKIETASIDDSSVNYGNGKAGSIFGILKEEEGRITYECEYCHQCFIDRSSIVQHRRIHTGEKPFKCDICKKSFAVKSSLTDHVRRHRSEKRFKCDACQKSFVSKSELNSHSRFHTGEKRFVEKRFRCNICERSFASNFAVIEHVRRHTGEKPFKCESCKKSFVAKRRLKYHSRSCTRSIASNGSKDTKAEEGRNDVVSSRTSENDKAVDPSTECSRIVDIDTVKHSEPCRKEKTSYSSDKCDKVFDGIFKLYKHKRWQCYYTALEAVKQQKLERGLSPNP